MNKNIRKIWNKKRNLNELKELKKMKKNINHKLIEIKKKK